MSESPTKPRAFYDLDGIAEDLRNTLATWDQHVTIERTDDRLTVMAPGLFPFDPPQTLEVSADGWCELHWSFPRAIVVKGIVDDHRVERVQP